MIAQRGESAAANPWRFSSEFADDELGCDYYNYREYEPVTGRWFVREMLVERANYHLLLIYIGNGLNHLEQLLYHFVGNDCIDEFDVGGLFPSGENDGWGSGVASKGNCWRYACNDMAKDKEETHAMPPPIITIPGDMSLYNSDGQYVTCDEIKQAMLRNPNIKLSNDGTCPGCRYAIFLALQEKPLDNGIIARIMRWLGIDVRQGYSDFHFYRQDTDENCKPTGRWSHKPGDLSVVVDVLDPVADAKKRGYEEPCAYFCIQCAGLDVDMER